MSTTSTEPAWRWSISTCCIMLRWPRAELSLGDRDSESKLMSRAPLALASSLGRRSLQARSRHASDMGWRQHRASVHRCHFCCDLHSASISSVPQL